MTRQTKTTARDTRIEDTPAVPDEPTGHAAAKGRDVRLHVKVDTAQRITQWCRSGVGNHRRTAAVTNLSDQSSQSAEHVVVNYTTEEPEHLPRASDQEGRNAEQWCWRCRQRIQEAVNYHKVSLERIRDRATAKTPVERERERSTEGTTAKEQVVKIRYRTVVNELVVKRR